MTHDQRAREALPCNCSPSPSIHHHEWFCQSCRRPAMVAALEAVEAEWRELAQKLAGALNDALTTLSGHAIGINCHGPSMDGERAYEALAAAREKGIEV